MPAMYSRHTIGQLFMVGIPHPVLDNDTRTLLQDLRPGGIILFRRNYTSPDALASLCAELHSLLPDSAPLIALDHEGGRVHRLNPPFTHFPPAASLGRIGSADLAQQVGLAMGRELRSVGIDIDFAPTLDVLTNPNNTVIGNRAFASDPQLVSQLGCAMARGLREGGVIPCGKHFPGHGATTIDSHADLPRDERGEEDLMRIDLVPFQHAIREQIEMIMTAHILYPKLDPTLPATLSPIIIDGLLRRRLGFQGVVVTDDLDMGAIVRHSSLEQATLNALKAGADLLLICHSLERAVVARDACARALDDGGLPQQRVTETIRRIEVLKNTHRQQPPVTTAAIGAEEHQQLADRIVQQTS